MSGFRYGLLAATILILRIRLAAACPTDKLILKGAENDVNGHYGNTDTWCWGQFVWKRISPATPERYIYFMGAENWAVSGVKCQNDVAVLLLRSMYEGTPPYLQAVPWEEKTAGEFRLSYDIKIVCDTCTTWSSWGTPGVCVRQNCMKKPRATEALCHAPCGGCGKAPSTITCLAGTDGINGTVVTITTRCNVVPCDGRVFSQKYEFIKYKFTAYRRWARAYMLRKCCVNFNANKAELAKRRNCTRVGGLV